MILLCHINVTMWPKQDHFTTLKAALQHENNFQLQSHSNHQTMIVVPTLPLQRQSDFVK